jgi:TetR/AcrR family transcriptional repressor of nem operon
MARPKEFNATEALEQAMEVFWAKGYEATSLQDLIGAMEISKSSFYETFGSKRDLFLSALGHYIDTMTESVVKLLDEEPSGKLAIEKLFRIIMEMETASGEVRGCFLCNCAVEISQRDSDAAVYVARGMDRIEEAFYRAVVRGQEAGEISAGRDPRALARFLVSSENGLIVMAKANRGGEAMADVARTVLSALG